MLLANRATPRLLATINACALISGVSGVVALAESRRRAAPQAQVSLGKFQLARDMLTNSVSFGLSTAAAPGTFGRSAVWVCMFLASLGPVLVVAALIEPPKNADIELAEDRQGLLAEE